MNVDRRLQHRVKDSISTTKSTGAVEKCSKSVFYRESPIHCCCKRRGVQSGQTHLLLRADQTSPKNLFTIFHKQNKENLKMDLFTQRWTQVTMYQGNKKVSTLCQEIFCVFYCCI